MSHQGVLFVSKWVLCEGGAEMQLQSFGDVVSVIGVLGLVGLVFLLIRQCVLWYWKINRIESLLVEIRDELKMLRMK